jgi:flagellar hook protein FlgE
MADDNGVLVDTLGDITIPVGLKAPSAATSAASMGGNLNAAAATGDVVNTSITVYDSLGNTHDLPIAITKTATANEWTWAVDTTDLTAEGITVTGGTGTLLFDALGRLDSTVVDPQITLTPAGGEFDPIVVDVSLGGGALGGLTQFAGSTTAALQDQNGYTWGTLQSYSIDRTGTITGAFSNGINLTLGQIALADFNNPGGLLKSGDNMYATSPNSGEANVAYASENSASSVASGALEMSNVDLTQEFTNMIIAQRGFQANSKVITSTDEMLQEIVNLKR